MAHKKEKLESSIRKKVGDLLLKDIKDSRIGYVTVTSVEISKDNSVASVGISILGNARDARKSLEGIKSAAGYIQHRLAKALEIRYVPRLEFFLDSSVADGVGMVDFLEGLTASDEMNSGNETPSAENESDEDDK